MNGSGKSTISNIISGIIPQTTGMVDVKGDTSIIAIGAGLKRNLTGAENIRLKGLMQGLTIKEIDEVRDSIIDFAISVLLLINRLRTILVGCVPVWDLQLRYTLTLIS